MKRPRLRIVGGPLRASGTGLADADLVALVERCDDASHDELDALREAIDAGRYQVDVEALADRLLAYRVVAEGPSDRPARTPHLRLVPPLDE